MGRSLRGFSFVEAEAHAHTHTNVRNWGCAQVTCLRGLWHTLDQLRRSRTKAASPTGVTKLPDSVACIPIAITDSLSNAEA